MAKKKKSHKPRKKQTYQASFGENIWNIIVNKKDTKGQCTKTTLVMLISLTLNTLAIILSIFGVAGLYHAVKSISTFSWNTVHASLINIELFAIFVGFSFIALMFAVILRGFANEIEREDDRNYIVAVFAGISAFFALIVALITYFKE